MEFVYFIEYVDEKGDLDCTFFDTFPEVVDFITTNSVRDYTIYKGFAL